MEPTDLVLGAFTRLFCVKKRDVKLKELYFEFNTQMINKEEFCDFIRTISDTVKL